VIEDDVVSSASETLASLVGSKYGIRDGAPMTFKEFVMMGLILRLLFTTFEP
jgi:hypothetical protein